MQVFDSNLNEGSMKGKHSPWKALLILSQVALLVATITINFLSSGSSPTPPGMFLSTAANISDEYFTLVTPAGWTFSTWGFIYTWQILHSLYSLSLLFRKNKNGGYLYTDPGHMHFSFYIVYMINNGFNNGWIFLFDREYVVVSCVFSAFMAFTIYICAIVICVYLDRAGNYLEYSGSSKEIWMTRMFALNGVAFYGTWVTIATLLNFVIALQYRAGVDPVTAVWIFLGFLSVELVIWFILETFVFDRYLRYCFSEYIILLLAFSGILSQHFNPAAPKPYYIYIVVLMAIVGVLAVVKVVVMFVKGRTSPISYNKIS